MYLYMYVCIGINECMFIYTHIYICIMCEYLNEGINVHYVYVNMSLYMWMCIHVHVYAEPLVSLFYQIYQTGLHTLRGPV